MSSSVSVTCKKIDVLVITLWYYKLLPTFSRFLCTSSFTTEEAKAANEEASSIEKDRYFILGCE